MDGFLKFALGGVAGAAVGTAIASLLAPQKGSELQAVTHNRLAAAKAAGDEAERQTAIAMKERFRQRVGDPTAFTAEADSKDGRSWS